MAEEKKMKHVKRLELPNLYNCRDMGGYVGFNDHYFVYNKLYRSDVPDRLTEEEWKTLENMGIRTVIDLRSPSECACMSYQVPPEIQIISMPLLDGEIHIGKEGKIQDLAKKAFSKSLTYVYEDLLFENMSQIVKILFAIMDGMKSGGVLFHCSLGKDRTGILAALIYKLCGISNEDIIEDYHMTEENIRQDARVKKLISKETESLFSSEKKTMETFLNQMEFRNIEVCLEQEGFSKSDKNKLIACMLR